MVGLGVDRPVFGQDQMHASVATRHPAGNETWFGHLGERVLKPLVVTEETENS
jgi:hypothetical protein